MLTRQTMITSEDCLFLNIWTPRPAATPAPVMVFIHGGSWRGGRADQFTVYAEPYVKAGANFVVLDFNNVGETNGDITPMVEQCRRAVAWVYRTASSFGGNPNELYLISRSSGSHLSSCVLITEWEKQGLPRDIVKGAVMGSGMYDLKPVRISKRSGTHTFSQVVRYSGSTQTRSQTVLYSAGTKTWSQTVR